MPAPAQRQPKNATFSIRVPAATKQLIESAAASLGQSASEFVLDAARSRASDVLLDRSLFVLGEEAFDAFVCALDTPHEPIAALRRLMHGGADR
jgi:uncharacterized protein (DUF1778 family)